MPVLISNSQAGAGRTFKKEQGEISPNHVQRLNLISVDDTALNYKLVYLQIDQCPPSWVIFKEDWGIDASNEGKSITLSATAVFELCLITIQNNINLTYP